MRLSVIEGDPGYSRDAVHHVTFLDGELIDWAVTADEELGLVRVLVQDPETGLVQRNPDGVPITKDWYGHVELRRLPA